MKMIYAAPILYLKAKSKVWGDVWHDFRYSSLRMMM